MQILRNVLNYMLSNCKASLKEYCLYNGPGKRKACEKITAAKY